jgi:SAM-dependent methyltransferase
MYNQIIKDLKTAYDQKVAERAARELVAWKATEREDFLALLKDEAKDQLLEVGSGTGIHGKFFQDNGLQVICTDLSPNMVACCRQQGLQAYAMDFLNLDFPADSFDAVFAMNCLLHIPRSELARVLLNIRDLLRPDGLFYWGQYGGLQQEGIYEDDHYTPKRFFSFLTDEQVQTYANRFFEVLKFKQISLKNDDMHFQGLVLRKIVEDAKLRYNFS